REVVDRAELVVGRGVVGDNYVDRPSRTQPDGGPNPDAEITLMNARIIDVITGGDRSRWPLAGDQLYVDLDLSSATCPAGTRLEVGSVVLEVTDHPHTGCQKFSRRFGLDARKWLNVNRTDERRRGIYARVVTAGEVTTGDQIRVVS
ncbi:MAG: MOSC domain-containing protein, partial [Ilumatobacter coccineus]